MPVTQRQLIELFEKAKREAFQDGIREGIRSAERIQGWMLSNHQLKEPHSPEVLQQWSDEEIKSLKSHLEG